jgi:hypothetical protein
VVIPLAIFFLKGALTMADFTVEIVERVSKNTGKPYTAFEIVFPTGYKKIVFLNDAEKSLVELCKSF